MLTLGYDIPEGFRRARMIGGYTQQELGLLLGISKETVSSYETGKTMPDIITIMNLASLTKCTLEEVVMIKRRIIPLLRSPVNEEIFNEFRDNNILTKLDDVDDSVLSEIKKILRKNNIDIDE